MRSSPIFKFCLKRGQSAGIEEAVVVDDGSEEKRMSNVGEKFCIGRGLEVAIGLFGGFMKEEDVVGFKADDGKLFAICSIAHQRNLFSLLCFD